MKQIVECVPNFSEGNNHAIIKQITDAIESVPGIKLLDVDPGKATNRTVVTFVGDPESVMEAAFRSIKKAAELIDMRFHKGEHPRFGATDVCPLVPVSGISMEETADYARKLAERILTMAKKNDLAARRNAFAVLRDETLVKRVFDEIGPRYTERDGGYTRIIKMVPRNGDAASMAILELVK